MYKYKRIMVIGCSGSGKSTFSRKLGEITGIPVTHLDRLFWKSGWVEEEREIFNAKHDMLIQTDSWIIDGHFKRTLPQRLEHCDVVYYYKIGRIKCITGYLRRLIKNYGKSRPDITEGCDEKLDLEFIKYMWNFAKILEKPVNEMLSMYPNKKVVIFKSRRQADSYLQKLSERISPEK